MADLRKLPKVDVLAAHERLTAYPPKVRTEASRRAVAALRDYARSGDGFASHEAIDLAESEAQSLMALSLRPAINASGVILHTGLGRARLASEASNAVEQVSRSHSLIEFDLENGKRGDRQEHVRDLLRHLTGAEDALVVNNAAAAVFLTLNVLASGGEVLLSRGQMVEIGGSFRLPDIVCQSGCLLREVGCTNKTRISDYEDAIGENTKAVLRCHPSNFKVIGFTAEPAPEQLAELCRRHSISLIDDVGSGCIVDTTRYGLSRQPTLQDSLKAGADVVIASGDKLLGGPQAGLILGSAGSVSQIAGHPLARAVRVDKLTLSALEATLRLYATGREEAIPTIRYMARPATEVRRVATRLARASRAAVVERSLTEVGGGSLPGEGIDTWRVGIAASAPEHASSALRSHEPPIIGRIENGRFWLDPRTLDDNEVKIVEQALRRLEA